MSSTPTKGTQMTHAQDIDTQLAAIYTDIYKIEDRQVANASTLLSQAGAEFYYRGRRRVTDMKVDEALEILNGIVKANEGESDYAMFNLKGGRQFAGSWNLGQVRRAIEMHEQLREDRALAMNRA